MIHFSPIGVIHTPYIEDAPFQHYEEAEGLFFIELFKEYKQGLYLLDRFRYIYILFYMDRLKKPWHLRVHPHRGHGMEVGLFATRSPNRINPIGLTTARIFRIENNRIYTSGLDILDSTPLLDIKPYVADVDMKPDANMGWIDPEREGSVPMPGAFSD